MCCCWIYRVSISFILLITLWISKALFKVCYMDTYSYCLSIAWLSDFIKCGYASIGNRKGPIGKSVFAENLPLQLFRVTVANADTENLKSLHTLFDTYLDYMLAKFEPNVIVQNELFNKNSRKKSRFYKYFRQKRWRHFKRRLCCWNKCLIVNC